MLAQIFEHSGVSVLIGLVALYFAYRVMVQKDLKGVLGKNKPEPEDKEGFSRDTGRLQQGHRKAAPVFCRRVIPDGGPGAL